MAGRKLDLSSFGASGAVGSVSDVATKNKEIGRYQGLGANAQKQLEEQLAKLKAQKGTDSKETLEAKARAGMAIKSSSKLMDKVKATLLEKQQKLQNDVTQLKTDIQRHNSGIITRTISGLSGVLKPITDKLSLEQNHLDYVTNQLAELHFLSTNDDADKGPSLKLARELYDEKLYPQSEQIAQQTLQRIQDLITD